MKQRIQFRLLEFKKIARWLDKNFPAPLSYFCKGWLYAFETAYIDAKVTSALERAIAPHRASQAPLTRFKQTTQPSEVEGLDIIETKLDVSHARKREGGK